MKLLSVITIAALLSPLSAFAKEVAIDCKMQMTAGHSASFTGTLQVTEQSAEYSAVEGTLRVFIGDSEMNSVLDAKVEVSGAQLEDGSISLASPNDESIAMIYINSNDKDSSGIDKDGTRYSSNCKK